MSTSFKVYMKINITPNGMVFLIHFFNLHSLITVSHIIKELCTWKSLFNHLCAEFIIKTQKVLHDPYHISKLRWHTCTKIWLHNSMASDGLATQGARPSAAMALTSLSHSILGFNTGSVNTLRPRQNGRHFPDDTFKCIYLMKIYKLRLQFHWSLFLRVQLTIFQHWFR